MNWPDVPLQPSGSMDCEPYAGAYLGRLLGYPVTPEDIKRWVAETSGLIARYPNAIYGAKAAWGVWGIRSEFDVSISFSQYPGFIEWVKAYTAHGCAGLAIMHLRADYGHAVVILEADETGVLLADSCRGLVRDSWERFTKPYDGAHSTRVEAWYRINRREGAQ